jgi:hypothetical protein
MILTTSKGLKQDVDLLGLDVFLSEKSLGHGASFSTGHYGRGEKAIRVSFCATGPGKTILSIFRKGMEFPSGWRVPQSPGDLE